MNRSHTFPLIKKKEAIMVRLFSSLILVLAFMFCFDASIANAQISRQNPYRSFNISEGHLFIP